MAVEATVGETCGLHHLRHADCIETLLAKQSARHVQNAAPILDHLLAADLHFKILHRTH
ncbi:hypothetical protein At1D1609_02580 [Agrobacterium tumefaciens]|uniref:Uncharacterized protein n=1 Tax=Agrobacterium tumefaciens TaxID=358 RepID=A0A2L2L7I9_AGRTU|nr:hypothetical protein At1D1609_02580 [Agrobacterium tumefaciens]